MQEKRQKRLQRHRRVRAMIRGTAQRPRFSVFRSNRHIWVQLVDDVKGHTLASVSDMEIKKRTTRIESARQVGALAAGKALPQGIRRAVFDRGGYTYHGIVKAAAEGAREGGLKI